MIKFMKSIPYHVKTALKSITRHLALSFSSVSMVTVTLTLLMVFLVVAGNVSNFTYSIEDSMQIYATIEATLNEEETAALQTTIEALPHVKSVVFSDKDQELESYISSLGNMDESSRKLYDTYQGEGNPLFDAFLIEVDHADELEGISAQVLSLEGIREATYGGDSATMLVKAMDGIRFVGAAFVVALSILAVFLISSTIKSAIYARNHEIAIMRNVGATNGFIKMPFMFEGMFIGMIGAILPMLVTFFGYQYVYETLHGIFLVSMFKMQPVMPFTLYVCLILLATGMVVGIIGSFFAVNKYLRWKR